MKEVFDIKKTLLELTSLAHKRSWSLENRFRDGQTEFRSRTDIIRQHNTMKEHVALETISI